MIRVELPAHLRTLARVEHEVTLDVAAPATVRTVLDALEAAYPVLRGTIRDHVTLKRRAFGTQIALYVAGSNKDRRPAVAMFQLDYLSCFLTVVATILVGRKMWTGLVVSGVNSLIVCVIGLHTSQYGFIPANVFCICINDSTFGHG